MPAVAGVVVMVRDGLNTNCHWPCQKSRQKVTYTQTAARPRIAATPPSSQRALVSGCCGANGFFQPGGGVCFLIFTMGLAEGEFVSRFERGSADTAEHCGAIAANQRIMHGLGAPGAPEV